MKDEQLEAANKKKAPKRATPPQTKKEPAATRSATTPRSAKSVASAKKKAPARARISGGSPAAPTRVGPTPDRSRRGKTITEEQRRSMIAERAYFKAERRGFVGGNPMQDWCDAEAEVDALILRGTEDAG